MQETGTKGILELAWLRRKGDPMQEFKILPF